ncbi:hypothetical protein Q7A53_05850 [Halobacillus rhizosphaerae]|uniref:hypothetical protein n=1 Tax=Halobacillus rhizosphaerae TaxID=3064889 RepID=UPI00398B1569
MIEIGNGKKYIMPDGEIVLPVFMGHLVLQYGDKSLKSYSINKFNENLKKGIIKEVS